MNIVSNSRIKHKKPPDRPLYLPTCAREQLLADALASVGYAVVSDFLKKPNGKRRLYCAPRVIVRVA
jgi:hypothetical protein